MSFDWRDFLEIADVLATFELTGRREDPKLEDAEAMCEMTLREAHELIDLLASL